MSTENRFINKILMKVKTTNEQSDESGFESMDLSKNATPNELKVRITFNKSVKLRTGLK